MQYFYSILKYQPSLGSDRVQSVGVIVEEADGRGDIYGIGYTPTLSEPVSDIGRGVLERLPDLLIELLEREARARRPGESTLSRAYSELAWNIFLEPPQSQESSDTLEAVATGLFSRNVLNVEDALQEAHTTSRPVLRRHVLFELAAPRELVGAWTKT